MSTRCTSTGRCGRSRGTRTCRRRPKASPSPRSRPRGSRGRRHRCGCSAAGSWASPGVGQTSGNEPRLPRVAAAAIRPAGRVHSPRSAVLDRQPPGVGRAARTRHAGRCVRDRRAGLRDLVFPAECVGCRRPVTRLCRCCAAAPTAVRARVRPVAWRCVAAAEYDGGLRAALLAYKERDRRELAAPLGGAGRAAPRGRMPTGARPGPVRAGAVRRRGDDHVAPPGPCRGAWHGPAGSRPPCGCDRAVRDSAGSRACAARRGQPRGRVRCRGRRRGTALRGLGRRHRHDGGHVASRQPAPWAARAGRWWAQRSWPPHRATVPRASRHRRLRRADVAHPLAGLRRAALSWGRPERGGMCRSRGSGETHPWPRHVPLEHGGGRMETALGMELVVHGRNVVVPDHYRHTRGRQAGQARAIRPEDHPDRRRTSSRTKPTAERTSCQHVEITCRTRGPGRPQRSVCGGLLQGARPRRGAAGAPLPAGSRPPPRAPRPTHPAVDRALSPSSNRPCSMPMRSAGPTPSSDEPYDGPGRVVREKEHPAKPMTVDQALVRDGTRRPRLLPVQRRRLRPRVGRVPPPRLRLRPDPPDLVRPPPRPHLDCQGRMRSLTLQDRALDLRTMAGLIK